VEVRAEEHDGLHATARDGPAGEIGNGVRTDGAIGEVVIDIGMGLARDVEALAPEAGDRACMDGGAVGRHDGDARRIEPLQEFEDGERRGDRRKAGERAQPPAQRLVDVEAVVATLGAVPAQGGRRGMGQQLRRALHRRPVVGAVRRRDRAGPAMDRDAAEQGHHAGQGLAERLGDLLDRPVPGGRDGGNGDLACHGLKLDRLGTRGKAKWQAVTSAWTAEAWHDRC
jgi:hypothetical protein